MISASKLCPIILHEYIARTRKLPTRVHNVTLRAFYPVSSETISSVF